MTGKQNEHQEDYIDLDDGRAPEVLEEKGVALQEFDDRVNQVCEENSEDKYQKDEPSEHR